MFIDYRAGAMRGMGSVTISSELRISLSLAMLMWERSVTRASVELYDMGERNGGRPEGEETKTP
mgnify:CR=1 FL=1